MWNGWLSACATARQGPGANVRTVATRSPDEETSWIRATSVA